MRHVLYEEVNTSVPRAMGQRDRSVLACLRGVAVLAGKFAVSAACFWYVSTRISWSAFADAATTINPAWVMFALGLMILQIPLVALRWAEIVGALAPAVKDTGRVRMLAITWIGIFSGQVVPNLFGEIVRVWMLVDLGVEWRTGLASVVIDRAIGVLVLVALAFVAFLVPPPLTQLGGHRADILLVLGAVLTVGAASLRLARVIGTILVHHRPTVLLGRCAIGVHDMLVQSPARVSIFLLALLAHVLTIAAIWSLARAEGSALPVEDAAVFFAVIGGVAIVPVVIGGWGLREAAVTALLQFQGIPAEKTLALSVSFGVLTFLASLPGAVMWVLYFPSNHSRTN
jgi:glycosyltransferase 2 family protein